MSTKVKCTCVSKKERQNWDVANPIVTEIELQVPYDSNSIYYQLSGGTGILLCTINPDAAGMFKIGGAYDVLISPAED